MYNYMHIDYLKVIRTTEQRAYLIVNYFLNPDSSIEKTVKQLANYSKGLLDKINVFYL